MYLVFSTSLHPDSRSRLLASEAANRLNQRKIENELIDLAELSLPPCDGEEAFSHPAVGPLDDKIRQAPGVLIASPVYNYDLSANAKNLVELTGSAWTDKLVGFLCAAGGPGSFMAPMGLANSLMLDFRCLILPRFVYVTDAAFRGNQLSDEEAGSRIDELVDRLVQIAEALS